MMKQPYNGNEVEPASPTTAPTIAPDAPPITNPIRKGDPSRIPYKRPEADPRPKA